MRTERRVPAAAVADLLRGIVSGEQAREHAAATARAVLEESSGDDEQSYRHALSVLSVADVRDRAGHYLLAPEHFAPWLADVERRYGRPGGRAPDVEPPTRARVCELIAQLASGDLGPVEAGEIVGPWVDHPAVADAVVARAIERLTWADVLDDVGYLFGPADYEQWLVDAREGGSAGPERDPVGR